jgi:hypothetical protein
MSNLNTLSSQVRQGCWHEGGTLVPICNYGNASVSSLLLSLTHAVVFLSLG